MAPSQSNQSSISSSNSANKFFIASVEQFPFTTSSSTSVVGLQRSCGASSKMHRSPSFLLIAGVVLVTLSMNVSGYAASSLDEHSSKSDSNLSKEEVQLSATSGLVKRSAPSHSSSYGHSIMRFGRAPHNIMHFGKRGGVAGSLPYDLESYLDQSTDALADSSSEIGFGAATNSIPEWIINNYLEKLVGGKQQQPHDSGRTLTKYMLVPITVRDPSSSSSFGPSSLTSSSQSANYPAYKDLSASPIKKAKLSEENDNVFMHFVVLNFQHKSTETKEMGPKLNAKQNYKQDSSSVKMETNVDFQIGDDEDQEQEEPEQEDSEEQEDDLDISISLTESSELKSMKSMKTENKMKSLKSKILDLKCKNQLKKKAAQSQSSSHSANHNHDPLHQAHHEYMSMKRKHKLLEILLEMKYITDRLRNEDETKELIAE